MKTIADLKRAIVPGRKITLTYFGGLAHKWLDVERTITQVNTTGFYISTDSDRAAFLPFPRKDEFYPIDECNFSLVYRGTAYTITYSLGELPE